jgi:Tfp pilus assembly protein PilE
MLTGPSTQRAQGGFALVGIIIAMAVASILAALGIQRSVLEVEQSLAEGSAAYLSEVAGATEQFLFQNWYEYGLGTDIPTVANDLRPTIAELAVNGKRLLPTFPLSMPTRQDAAIFITRTNCPGANCLLTALTCTTTPITFGRADTRFDLASIMMTSQHGIGGQARQTDPGNIVGPALNVPNPYGNTAGIVCASARVDTAIMMQMVRMGDTRDPALRGNLSVAGTIQSASSVGAGVVNPGDCAKASLETPGAVVTRRTDCTKATEMTASNAQLTAYDTSGNATTAMNGITGRVSAQVARITTTATAGTSCASGLEGDIALDAEATVAIVTCRSGLWRRPGLEPAVDGASCARDGALGQGSTGMAYLCRGGVWTPLQPRIGRSIVRQRYLVGEGTHVPFPTDCPAGSQPAILMHVIDGAVDTTGSPSRNKFAHLAEKGSSGWITRLGTYDGTGARYTTSFSGAPYNMRSIAEVSCDFSN